MRAWSVVVSADRFAAERLYDHDILELVIPAPSRPSDRLTPELDDGVRIAAGDRVALVADVEPRIVFALARAVAPATGPAVGSADDPGADQGESFDGTLILAYTHRFFDNPRPAPTAGPARIGLLPPGAFEELAKVGPEPARSWLVRLDLPIEAATPAEAVRRFWTYVHDLGPAELPALVSPTDDELAMQAFVLGAEANQDPEEDE